MKKLMLLVLGLLAISCTNAEVVKYNKDRLDVIEDYLYQTVTIKENENFQKLKEKGEIEYTKQYKSLEKESEAWKKEQK